MQKRLDEAEIASQWIHHFDGRHFGRFNPHGWAETPMFSKLSATHVPGVAQSTTEALANMDSYSPKHVERWSYCSHPKYGWKMENMSQTTSQLTIGSVFFALLD